VPIEDPMVLMWSDTACASCLFDEPALESKKGPDLLISDRTIDQSSDGSQPIDGFTWNIVALAGMFHVKPSQPSPS